MIGSGKTAVIPIMTHSGIELTGHTVRQAVTDGEVHAAAVEALHRRFPTADAATVIMDLTVEAEAFGAELYLPEHEIPSIIGRLVSTPEEVEALAVPTVMSSRIPEYLKADRLAVQYMGDKPVFGGVIGPFSLAGRLYDMTEIMMGIYIEPDTIRLLLDKCTAFITSYLKEMKKTGVAGVIMAEPAAGLLGNDDVREFSSTYVRQIIEEVQDDSFAVILHNCGNTGHCTEAMVMTGARGYHFGNKADMVEALQQCPSDALVMGNIDPVSVLKDALPSVVYEKTAELMSSCSKYPNFVLSTGCDTPPNLPIHNIEALYRAAEA